MDVAERVDLYAQLPKALRQVCTSHWNPLPRHVENVPRGTMRYQHVGMLGDQRPFLGELAAAFEIERPVIECRLSR